MQKGNLLTVVVAMLILTSCSGPAPEGSNRGLTENGVVGGWEAKPNDPYSKSVVGIYLYEPMLNRPLRQICTGTLISKNVVLTAAHCVDAQISSDPRKYLVSFGSTIIRRSKDLRKVFLRRATKTVIHPLWDNHNVTEPKKAFYDIALLQFENEAPSGYRPARVASSNLELQKQDYLLIYGYGLTMKPGKMEATQLMRAFLNVADWTYSPTHLEASRQGSSICSGDSGGPAFVLNSNNELTVVGVTSFAPVFCDGESYFTRVSTFSNWIRESFQQF